MTAQEQVHAGMRIAFAVADTIKASGEVPETAVYLPFMHHGCSLESFRQIIGLLIKAGVVERTPSHLLRWTGPAAA